MGEASEPSSEAPISSDEGRNETMMQRRWQIRDVMKIESIKLSDQMNGRMMELGEALHDSRVPIQETGLPGIRKMGWGKDFGGREVQFGMCQILDVQRSSRSPIPMFIYNRFYQAVE